jgi:hypothetical protein
MPFPFNSMFMDHLRETKERIGEHSPIDQDQFIDSYVVDSLGYLNRINYFLTMASSVYQRR